jgi:hypothetical protein
VSVAHKHRNEQISKKTNKPCKIDRGAHVLNIIKTELYSYNRLYMKTLSSSKIT